MSEKTRAELKEQIKIMNHNYQVIREMHEKGYQYSVSEIKRLQDELDRTRKALGIIKKEMSKEIMPDFAVIHNALKMAEQKDVK